MRPDSDLDLFVVRPSAIDVQDVRWRAQLDGLAAEATEWTGNDTRVLEFGEDEVAGGWNAESVLDSISAEGIVVYGSSNWLRQRRKPGRSHG